MITGLRSRRSATNRLGHGRALELSSSYLFKILLQHFLGSVPRFKTGFSENAHSQVREFIGSQFTIHTMEASTFVYVMLGLSRETSDGLVTRLLAGRPKNRRSIPENKLRLFFRFVVS
jgi:hypothetical protein